MRFAKLVLIASVVLTGGGAMMCCSKEETPPSYWQYWNRIETAQRANAAQCSCATELGYPSEAICRSELEPDSLTATQKECLGSVLQQNEVQLNPALRCQGDAFVAAGECVAAVSGCDTTAITACNDARVSALSACTQVDPSIQNAVNSCLGAP